MRKHIILSLAIAVATTSFGANLASDNASNPPYSDGWQSGDNGGTGFSAWTIATGGGGFSGAFIGDPAAAGIGGMSPQSFGLYANPEAGNPFVNADRGLTGGGLSVGQTFSFQWGANWDSNGTGNKGFNLYVGGVSGTQVVNVNMGGFPGIITFNGNNTGFTYGTNVMTWSFTMMDPTTLGVLATPRNPSDPNFTTNITVSAGIDAFRLYASSLDLGDQRQPYFNNFEVVPEPSTIALGLIGLAAIAARRFRKA
jgi:hypothetical protein